MQRDCDMCYEVYESGGVSFPQRNLRKPCLLTVSINQLTFEQLGHQKKHFCPRIVQRWKYTVSRLFKHSFSPQIHIQGQKQEQQFQVVGCVKAILGPYVLLRVAPRFSVPMSESNMSTKFVFSVCLSFFLFCPSQDLTSCPPPVRQPQFSLLILTLSRFSRQTLLLGKVRTLSH